MLTRVLGWLAALGLCSGVVMAFVVAPRELTQGNVQRIMYLHVPSAWVAYLAFAVVFVASAIHLWKRTATADRLAHASAETGVVFTGLAIASGSIWGKPTWGAWWTWDARLTTTALLFVIYLGYLLLRGVVEDRERAGRYAAVVGIVGFLDVPLVHQSVLWWRTLHQPPSVARPEGGALPPAILAALLVNVLAFTLVYTYFVRKRSSLLELEEGIAR